MNTIKMMIIGFFIIVTALISCRKDEDKQLIKQLEGRWELSKSSGGLDGKTVFYPKGSGNILEFNGLSFRETRNSQVIRSGTFKITKEVGMVSKKEGDRIQFDNSPDTRYFLTISDNSLSIDIDVVDPTSLTYYRID